MSGTENKVIRKRLNTYKTSSGQLRGVDDEVVLEVLRAWERWEGTAASLYRELGLSKMQLVTMIQKAKRLVKKGAVTGGDFKEITVSSAGDGSGSSYGIELSWEKGHLIRFRVVGQLVEFLKLVDKDGDI